MCLSTLAVPSTALLKACGSEETEATTCWATKLCAVGGECDIPDPDLDKTCTEENNILDEAASCCPSCKEQVEAIRSCRCPSTPTGSEESAPSPTPPTDGETTANRDKEDDPTNPLPLCSDEMSAVDTCYAENIGVCDNNCDAYDQDVDKTCTEEGGILSTFVSCCDVCSSQAVAVYDCRCGSEAAIKSGVSRVCHTFSAAIMAIIMFIGSSGTF